MKVSNILKYFRAGALIALVQAFALNALADPSYSCDEHGNKFVSFNISSFNMWVCESKRERAAWEKRKDFVIPLMHFYEFDICGAQEPFWEMLEYWEPQLGDFKYICRLYKKKYTREDFADRKNPHQDMRLKMHHNPIFFRDDKFEILKEGSFYFSPTPDVESSGFDPEKGQRRTCVWAKFREKYSGAEFFVFNAHYDHINKDERLKSSKVLLEKIREITEKEKSESEKTFPLFITGDFNSTLDEECLKEILNSKLVRDSLSSSLRSPYGPTTRPPAKNSNARRKLIDHVFVSPEVVVEKYGVLTDNVGGVYPSDHFPILIRAKIPVIKGKQ